MSKRLLCALLLAASAGGCFVTHEFNIASDKRFTLAMTVSSPTVRVFSSDQFLSKEEFSREWKKFDALERFAFNLPTMVLSHLGPVLTHKTRTTIAVPRPDTTSFDAFVMDVALRLFQWMGESKNDPRPVLSGSRDEIIKAAEALIDHAASEFGLTIDTLTRTALVAAVTTCGTVSGRSFSAPAGSAEAASFANCAAYIDELEKDRVFKAGIERVTSTIKTRFALAIKAHGSPARNEANGALRIGSGSSGVAAEFRFYRYKGADREFGLIVNNDRFVGEYFDYGDAVYAVRTRDNKSGSAKICPETVSAELCSGTALRRPEAIPAFFQQHANAYYYLVNARPSPAVPAIFFWDHHGWFTWEEALRTGRRSVKAATDVAREGAGQTAQAAKELTNEGYQALKRDLKDSAKSMLPSWAR